MRSYFLKLFSFIIVLGGLNLHGNEKDYDIVIYGATSSGIIAAVQGARLGKKVVLIHPGVRIGGLTAGGLGATDIGNKRAIGGLSREFYERIYDYYNESKNWKWQLRSDYKTGHINDDKPENWQLKSDFKDDEREEKTMWTFEPSAALQVFKEMIEGEDIDVVVNGKLNRNEGVIKKDSRITEICLIDGRTFRGYMFIDATYEGDLMAAADVSYAVGRESNETYGETLNGFQLYYKKEFKENLGKMEREYFERPFLQRHQFPDGVDPYIIPGDESSGLLWGISDNSEKENGSGDNKIQAYNIRITLTNNPFNRVPITKPDCYDPNKYELFIRLLDSRPDLRGLNQNYFIRTNMPNMKTDINNKNAFSTDMIGANYEWPEASYEKRKLILKKHIDYTKGFLYFLKTDPRIPKIMRDSISKWGFPKDEFVENEGHISHELYIREGRRMIGSYIMTENNVNGSRIVNDPIGLAAYGMDSHHTQRIVIDGMVKNEGDIQVHGYLPYPISYRSIIPKEKEAKNLLVPVAVSASHIAFGSIRMEPVFMLLGQSAAIAASLSIDDEVSVQRLQYNRLRNVLLKSKQILEWDKSIED